MTLLTLMTLVMLMSLVSLVSLMSLKFNDRIIIMKNYFYAIMFVITMTTFSNAQTFNVTGSDSLTQVSIGDTVRLSVDDEDITIQIESSTRLLVKGGTLLSFDGGERSLNIILDDGQLFIDRDRRGERELDTLRVLSQGFIFVPTGTAFGVKATPQGAPTLAVLRGTAQMQNANDTVAVEIGVGQFATVNSNGVIVSGELSNRGVAQLEAWSGVKLTTEEEIEEEVEEVVEEDTTITIYIEVDEEEDDTWATLSKKELRRLRREERQLEKIARREERRVAKEMRRQARRAPRTEQSSQEQSDLEQSNQEQSSQEQSGHQE